MEPSADVPGDQHSAPLSELEAALHSLLIETRYQPIVRLSDRKPVALEALARMNHPTRGFMLPEAFMPQLEGAGLAPQLTEQVARRAFRDLTGGTLKTFQLDVALNLPLDMMLGAQAVEMLDAERRNAGISASRVIVELTESQPVEDLPALKRATERLRTRGYHVAIDDVEPGVPQLEALLDLPFDGLKLDKAFVGMLATDDDAHDFAKRLIEKAKRRDLTIIAEGIENEEMWGIVAALGVDLAQGFFAARPLMTVAVPIWLRRWSKRRHFEVPPPPRG